MTKELSEQNKMKDKAVVHWWNFTVVAYSLLHVGHRGNTLFLCTLLHMPQLLWEGNPGQKSTKGVNIVICKYNLNVQNCYHDSMAITKWSNYTLSLFSVWTSLFLETKNVLLLGILPFTPSFVHSGWKSTGTCTTEATIYQGSKTYF